jgi:hypothetical protein
MAAVETVQAQRRGREERLSRRTEAAKLKTLMDPWITKLGGWDKVGMKADIAAIAAHLAPEDDPVPAAYVASTISILVGGLGSPGPEPLAALWRTHEVFAASKDPQATYVALIREAHGIPVLLDGQDWPYTVELLQVDDLFADQDYQRPEHDQFIREMLIGFDERLVGTLDVSRRSTGKKRLAILDGQQRWATMRQIGKKTVWCAVYEGMDITDEAAFFYHKNRDRKTMAYYYAFRARQLSGDSNAVLIGEIVEETGYKLGPNTDSLDVIGAVKAVEDVYELPGGRWGNALTPSLATMRSCFYGRPSSLDGALLRGLGRFFSLFDESELQMDHWKEMLTSLGPQLILGRARDLNDSPSHTGSKIGVAVATQLAAIHNQGLQRHLRLDLERIPKPQRLVRRRRKTF